MTHSKALLMFCTKNVLSMWRSSLPGPHCQPVPPTSRWLPVLESFSWRASHLSQVAIFVQAHAHSVHLWWIWAWGQQHLARPVWQQWLMNTCQLLHHQTATACVTSKHVSFSCVMQCVIAAGCKMARCHLKHTHHITCQIQISHNTFLVQLVWTVCQQVHCCAWMYDAPYCRVVWIVSFEILSEAIICDACNNKIIVLWTQASCWNGLVHLLYCVRSFRRTHVIVRDIGTCVMSKQANKVLQDVKLSWGIMQLNHVAYLA